MRLKMKIFYRCLSKAFFMIALDQCVLAQGTFQNLSFESARNIPIFNPQGHPWYMPVADAFPGWSIFTGPSTVSDLEVTYNDITLDLANIALLPRDAALLPPAPGLIDGKYGVLLQSGFSQFGKDTPVSLAQVGRIPSGTKSIQFRGSGPLSVSFNGNSIPLAALNSGNGTIFFGGDVVGYAGLSGELRFTSQTHFDYLDAIQFSPVAVPEPATLSLLLGGLAFSIMASLRRTEN
jgi:hypothetical protein